MQWQEGTFWYSQIRRYRSVPILHNLSTHISQHQHTHKTDGQGHLMTSSQIWILTVQPCVCMVPRHSTLWGKLSLCKAQGHAGVPGWRHVPAEAPEPRDRAPSDSTLIPSCQFNSTLIPSCQFNSTLIPSCQFNSTLIPSCQFNIVIPSCQFNSTVTPNCQFNSIVIPSCQFNSTVTPSCQFNSTITPSCQFNSTITPSCQFNSTVIPSCQFNSAVIPSCQFNVQLSPLHITPSVDKSMLLVLVLSTQCAVIQWESVPHTHLHQCHHILQCQSFQNKQSYPQLSVICPWDTWIRWLINVLFVTCQCKAPRVRDNYCKLLPNHSGCFRRKVYSQLNC